MSEVADALRVPTVRDLDDRELVEELERRGWILHQDDPKAERHIELDAPKRGKVRCAFVSDTHLGSKYQQVTYWRQFYEAARAFRVDYGFHLGDVVDGSHKMHRGMEYEQFRLGYEAQRAYAVEAWPELRSARGKQLTQYVIGGNHDASFHADVGANILSDIGHERPDVEFLGAPAATFHISGVQIYLLHPDGGVPYARSYRPQKAVEQIAPDEKPNLWVAGHWHVPVHVPGYRNVEAFTLPCFQSQTPYLRQKALAPVVGGLLMEIEFSERGLEDLTTRWVIFRSPMEKDWP